MTLELELPVKPFSLNRYHYSDRRHKTQEARDYETTILALLEDEKGLVDMAALFVEQGGSFSVELSFEHPVHVYYNKLKQISSKSFDLSNLEKPLLDLIFNETMGVDDKHVTRLISRKFAGSRWCIHVRLKFYSEA